jgi:hypothetical protein
MASKDARDADHPCQQTPKLSLSNNTGGCPPSSRKVRVLLLNWDEEPDHIGASDISRKLGTTFQENFGFDPIFFRIPPQNPTQAVKDKIQLCRDSFSGPDDLLIVSYVGHSCISGENELELWSYE